MKQEDKELLLKDQQDWSKFQKPFKDGDIVITNSNEHAFIYSGENDNYWECYCGVYCGTRNICINSKQWSDRQHKLRLATKKEIEKLFQVIKDNGYKWNPETKTLEKLIAPKFDITTLIPFESRVLVRDYNNDNWKASFWGCLTGSKYGFKYDTVRGLYRQCIPYENNEHLLGKRDDCVDFYKNWE